MLRIIRRLFFCVAVITNFAPGSHAWRDKPDQRTFREGYDLALKSLWISSSSPDRYALLKGNLSCRAKILRQEGLAFDHLGEFPPEFGHDHKGLLNRLCTWRRNWNSIPDDIRQIVQPYVDGSVKNEAAELCSKAESWFKQEFPVSIYSKASRAFYLTDGDKERIRNYIRGANGTPRGITSELNEALLKIPSWRKVTYRVAEFGPDVSSTITPGSILKSTQVNSSAQLAVAGSFEHVCKNTYIMNGISAKSVAHLSETFMFSEREAMFPAGTSFIIVRSKFKAWCSSDRQTYKIYLREIPNLHYWRDYLNNIAGAQFRSFAPYFAER